MAAAAATFINEVADVEVMGSLLSEVGLVEKELEKFHIQKIDANEIFELLEKNSFREDRVCYVTEHLLNTLGLKHNFVEFDSDECDDYEDNNDMSEYYCSVSSPECVDITEDNAQNGNIDNSNCGVESYVHESEAQDKMKENELVENDFIEKATEGNSLQQEDSNFKIGEHISFQGQSQLSAVPQNEDFLCDVNNNDPNNNIEYSLQEPQETDSGEFKDQDEIRFTLLEEARLIHRIVPRQNLGQIFSYLEANLDSNNRVQIVMQEFLKMDFECKKLKNIDLDISSKMHERTDSPNKLVHPESDIPVSDEEMVILKRDAEKAGFATEVLVDESPGKKMKNSMSDCMDLSFPKPSTSHTDNSEAVHCKSPTPQSLQDSETSSQTLLLSDSEIEEVSSAGVNSVCVDISECKSMKNSPDRQQVADQNNKVLTVSDDNFKIETIILDSPSNPESELKDDNMVIDTSLNQDQNPLSKSEIADNSKIILTDTQKKYKSSLMEMFPNIAPDYLGHKCKAIENEEQLSEVVTSLLENNDYPVRQIETDNPEPGTSTSAEETTELNSEMLYKTLISILPNADPEYLRNQCEIIGSDEDALKAFVTDALEGKSYPTKEDYLKRKEAIALQKKYTEQFSVESFLEVFPDPFKYFLEEKASSKKDINDAIEYLKRRYKKVRCCDLRSTYKLSNWNLSLACETLDKYKGNLRTSRPNYKDTRNYTFNIPFSQEVAFIENKDKIRSFLQERQEKRKMLFEEAKSKGELLQCGCCYNNELLIEDISTCTEGHIFCKECIRKGAEMEIGNGKTNFPCLGDCQAEFSLMTLQSVLKPSVFSKMIQRKQLEEVKAAGIEDLETCPFCDFANIPSKEDKIFRCLNPECMRESCRNCKEPNHIPLRCDEVETNLEVKMRTYIEDRMTEALVRTCWRCSKKFIKEDGCNKMTCTCGAIICYICRQPVKDYTHFNGQGGTEHHKCPLYSTNDEIHVTPVEEEAKKAKKEVQAQNPEVSLKHDPTSKLPKATYANKNEVPFPEWINGPHILIPPHIYGVHPENLRIVELPQPRPDHGMPHGYFNQQLMGGHNRFPERNPHFLNIVQHNMRRRGHGRHIHVHGVININRHAAAPPP